MNCECWGYLQGSWAGGRRTQKESEYLTKGARPWSKEENALCCEIIMVESPDLRGLKK